MKTVYENYYQSSIPNPNPAASLRLNIATITPIYIATLGNYTTSSTALNVIYEEFSVKIKGSISLINNAKQASNQIDKNIANIKESLNDIISKVNSIRTGLVGFENNIINKAIDYV